LLSQDYLEYINSPEWREKAEAAKKRAGYRCQVCNRPRSEVQLDAHHRTYERLGHEDDGDITVLCRRCHDLFENTKKANKKPKNKGKKDKGKKNRPKSQYEETSGPSQITSQSGWRHRPRQINWDEE